MISQKIKSFNILLKRIQPTPKKTKPTRGPNMKKGDKIAEIQNKKNEGYLLCLCNIPIQHHFLDVKLLFINRFSNILCQILALLVYEVTISYLNEGVH